MLYSIYHMTLNLLWFFISCIKTAPLCIQRCYGRHNVSRKSVNQWFIDFIAWRYFTSRGDVT